MGVDQESARAALMAEKAELEDLRAFRRAVLELAVPQWRPHHYTRNDLLNDLRALLGDCAGCDHPDHRAEACPSISRGDVPCPCRT